MATKRADTEHRHNIAEMAAAELTQSHSDSARKRLRNLYLDRVAGRAGRRVRSLMGRQARRS